MADIDSKLDRILNKIETLDKKMDSVESKMDSRMTVVENQCVALVKLSNKQGKVQKFVLNEVVKLKIKVNQMEQRSIRNNIIIRGVLETEKEESDTPDLVDDIMHFLSENFESQFLLSARRVGKKRNETPRHILVEMKDGDKKLDILKSSKVKGLNCAQFKLHDVPWGTSEKKIFLGDHLTAVSNNLFYHARQLKKKGLVKYAWSKLGVIFVKEDDDSDAFRIDSVEQLAQFKSSQGGDVANNESESDVTIETESDFPTDGDLPSKTSSERAKRKYNHSPNNNKKKSPRPKRVKNAVKRY